MAVELEFVPNKKRVSLKAILIKNLSQFCNNTSLHGLKYFTDKELNVFQRVFFGWAFVTVVLLSGYFVQNILEKWNDTPVIFGTNSFPTHITKEPFPTVVICNLNVAYKRIAQNYSKNSHNYALTQMLCKKEINMTVDDSITSWDSLRSFLSEIAQPCGNMILACRFGAIKYKCSDLFRTIITDKGICCAFNRLHPMFTFKPSAYNASYHNYKPIAFGGFVPVDWSPENGYQKNLPENDSYDPRPAVGVGETLGLSVVLNVEANEYYCSSINSIGFKISINSPLKTISLEEKGLLLRAGYETKIFLRPEKFDADENIRVINFQNRQCWFEDEFKLKSHSKYSKSYCETECLARKLIRNCSCITYYIPRLSGRERVCSVNDMKCVERMQTISKVSIDEYGCDGECLPSCNELNYNPTFYSAPLLADQDHHTSIPLLNDMNSSYVKKNIAIVHIFYKENLYRSVKRTVFFSGTDALSNIGGLLSLFLGFGFMSFAEIIFYVLVKPFRETRTTKKVKKDSPAKESPSWKKPIRKRFKAQINLSPYRKLFRNESVARSNKVL